MVLFFRLHSLMNWAMVSFSNMNNNIITGARMTLWKNGIFFESPTLTTYNFEAHLASVSMVPLLEDLKITDTQECSRNLKV